MRVHGVFFLKNVLCMFPEKNQCVFREVFPKTFVVNVCPKTKTKTNQKGLEDNFAIRSVSCRRRRGHDGR